MEGSIRKRKRRRDGERRIRATTGEDLVLIASKEMRRGVKRGR